MQVSKKSRALRSSKRRGKIDRCLLSDSMCLSAITPLPVYITNSLAIIYVWATLTEFNDDAKHRDRPTQMNVGRDTYNDIGIWPGRGKDSDVGPGRDRVAETETLAKKDT